MEPDINKLPKRWKNICNDYLKVFCTRHGYAYEPDMWVSNDVGTIIDIADMFITMEQIRYDVDNDVPDGVFERWYWKRLDLAELGIDNWLNYENYCKGAPNEWTEEKIRILRDGKERLNKAKKDFEETLKRFKKEDES